MNADPLAELRQFQEYVLGVQRLMSDMQERIPQEVTGSDPQGAVTVRLAPDGLPVHIGVATDWQQRQDPAGLGSAVVAACESALRERMENWSRSLAGSDWERRAEQLDADSPFTNGTFANGKDRPSPQTPTEEPDLDLRHVLPRQLDEVAEELLSLFGVDGTTDAGPTESPAVTGKSATGTVALTVTQGSLAGCSVDPAWADGRSSVRLNQAFGEALAAARAALDSATGPGPGMSAPELDGLFKEAMAILGDPARFAG
ncbi:hypothetical protein GCM10020221_13360 [Streptomyces thioluteus]|uniref:YbaB/EbfC DNA-binding family protein n=1 Tax=Streptomyces thioluteus TaxID=66431 RepID=A0ABN3WL50_STRTU